MGEPRKSASATNTSVGFPSRLVTISSITPDGTTAIAVDRQGNEVRVPMSIQPAKGILPEPGEQWIVVQGIANSWTFAAIATSDATVFTNSQVAGEGQLPGDIIPPAGPPAPGSIPGSAIEPGSLTGAEIAVQSITNLNLATAAAATNVILDPQFTSGGVNAVRQADPGTTCTWTFATPNVSVAGGLAVCTLALMPSTLVPLYVNPGEQYFLSVGVTLPTGTTGVSAGIQFAFNDGSFGGPLLPVNPGANTVAQLVTIPAGVASAYVRLIVSALPSGRIATFTQPVCYITQGPNQLQPGSVGNANLQANSVAANNMQAGSVSTNALQANSINSSKIQANQITAAQLVTGIVVSGIVNATTITGATLQNSSTDPRTSINPDGSFTITNAAGVVIFKIGPDGTVYWNNGTTGQLVQEIQPGGTQLVYASPTGPQGWGFESPVPVLLVAATSTASATIYSNQIALPVAIGAVITVTASCNSTITVASSVSDSQGNTYTLLQSQSTSSPTQQVFQSVITHALATTDSISVTYSQLNTQGKCIVATAIAGVLNPPLDYSAQASGTSTAPSVSGTPTAWGEAILMIISNGGTAGPSAVPDGWDLIGQTSATGTQTTSVYSSVNLASSGAFPASATLPSSLGWTAVTVGYQASPAQSLAAFSPVPTAATISASTQWADQGTFSAKVTKVGTAASWGVAMPPIPCQAGSQMAVHLVVGTLNIALGAFEFGFTFYSGPNGTGTNLGNSFWSYGAVPFNVFQAVLLYGANVPAGAQSCTVYAMERQADTAGNWFLLDTIQVPGGLAYSNSPVAAMGPYGNQVDQGINFVAQPSSTNLFGVEDLWGNQLVSIDGTGDIQAQNLSANTDVFIAGQSVTDMLASLAAGLVNYGYIAANPWPATPMNAAGAALFELDATFSANRIYEFVMNPTGIRASVAGASVGLGLHYTSDGSTPTTSSPLATNITRVLPTANTADSHPGLRCEFFPTADGLWRFLVTGAASSGTYQFTQDPFIRCYVNDLGLNDAGQGNNSISVIATGGTGGGGGAPSQQTYTEYFYGNNTWSYWEYGQRNHNGTIYQGAYSGEGYAQYGYIQWGFGSLGNALNTVLNYTVQKVTLRLLNQHSWYNSGMTVSWHTSDLQGSISHISSEWQNWHINEGQMLTVNLSVAAWQQFKNAGTTYGVLSPKGGSQDLSYYGYFWGGGTNNSNVPRLAVTYTH